MSAALSVPENGCVTPRSSAICSVCSHPQRAALDAGIVRGDRDTTLASLFGLSHDAVRRHRERHLRKELRHSLAVRGRSWTGRVDKLARKLERQIDCHEDPDVVTKTASVLRATLRDLGEAAGEFPKQDVNVLVLGLVGAQPVEARQMVERGREAEVLAENPQALAARLCRWIEGYAKDKGMSVAEVFEQASGAEVIG